RLSDDHPYRGTILDRVVIGQRLGLIYSNPDYRPFFAEPVERYLAKLIAESNDRALQERWLCDGKVRPGLIRGSVLRAAPALGAAVAAARAYAFPPSA
ncbi:MAG: hypothetical protein ACE5GE_17430, partial [Phycisphaerae bacterium]